MHHSKFSVVLPYDTVDFHLTAKTKRGFVCCVQDVKIRLVRGQRPCDAHSRNHCIGSYRIITGVW